MPPEYDLLDDRDPSHYVRGAPEAAKLLGGVSRPRVHHLVRAGRLRSWPASLIYGQAARSGKRPDRAYYIPDLERLQAELNEGGRRPPTIVRRSKRMNRISGGSASGDYEATEESVATQAS